ncbi:tRNA glutamyl-Q(34) synthetase GluQRS [Acetobacter fallax]|uniref:tRNA glutamyl-Q(34) synthetase GluQRS n=1 Tax=Acetobacter fallax TaxID=1737473 RepID=A0ABX0K7J7_9PROT|nr:tRNA glutamyl-Q(34) synthetase GluQRS [Acetobacter fallax]NHO31737.1 tRNA glutamyl-Q(34) synthetase GluQRS [Acetobacter fallax]NHO35296.1 tRNA glutamyl-Q(34) synthetase GluQRS [Acetobacter fallax]
MADRHRPVECPVSNALFPVRGPVTTRFAPSPTGPLHLGHVAAAFFAGRHAGSNGRFLLRIEDIDTRRCRKRFVDETLEDLTWVGLRWDGPVIRQSARMVLYRETLAGLAARGLVYPCFCTRAEIAREVMEAASAPHHAPDGSLVYPGICRGLDAETRARRIASGQSYALRLDVARAVGTTGRGPLTFRDLDRGVVTCDPVAFGDVVLARRDVPVSYNLCVTQDDAAQGVTLVTRGVDLRNITAIHRLLQELMGWPVPDYAFHPLLCDAAGKRLSKRSGALSVRAMREAGMSAEAVRQAAGVRDSLRT